MYMYMYMHMYMYSVTECLLMLQCTCTSLYGIIECTAKQLHVLHNLFQVYKIIIINDSHCLDRLHRLLLVVGS